MTNPTLPVTIPNPNKPITSGVAASRLGVSSATVTRWANDGLVAYKKTPKGRMLFDPAVIDALAETMSFTTTTPAAAAEPVDEPAAAPASKGKAKSAEPGKAAKSGARAKAEPAPGSIKAKTAARKSAKAEAAPDEKPKRVRASRAKTKPAEPEAPADVAGPDDEGWDTGAPERADLASIL